MPGVNQLLNKFCTRLSKGVYPVLYGVSGAELISCFWVEPKYALAGIRSAVLSSNNVKISDIIFFINFTVNIIFCRKKNVSSSDMVGIMP